MNAFRGAKTATTHSRSTKGGRKRLLSRQPRLRAGREVSQLLVSSSLWAHSLVGCGAQSGKPVQGAQLLGYDHLHAARGIRGDKEPKERGIPTHLHLPLDGSYQDSGTPPGMGAVLLRCLQISRLEQNAAKNPTAPQPQGLQKEHPPLFHSHVPTKLDFHSTWRKDTDMTQPTTALQTLCAPLSVPGRGQVSGGRQASAQNSRVTEAGRSDPGCPAVSPSWRTQLPGLSKTRLQGSSCLSSSRGRGYGGSQRTGAGRWQGGKDPFSKPGIRQATHHG